MPVAPDFYWDETPTHITLRVALKGALVRRPDITLTNALLKISSPPYLLTLDLFRDTVADKATAELSAEGLQLRLPKVSLFSYSCPSCQRYIPSE